ncbi:MAG: hypothetical protein R3F22_02015 [Lysobacteraceae bacterium]
MKRRTVKFVTALVALCTVATVFWQYLNGSDHTRPVLVAVADDTADEVVAIPHGDAFRKQIVRQSVPARGQHNDADSLDDGSVLAAHVRAFGRYADDGDLAAAVQIFEESYECWLYHEILEIAAPAMLADDRVFESASSDAEDFDREEAELRRLQRIIEAATPLCAGSDAREVAVLFQKSLFRAARQGHLPAQSCYVSGPKVPRWASAEYSNALIDEYLQHAPNFANNVLEHAEPWAGVWNAAFRLIASPPFHPSRLDDLPLPDPIHAWRAVRLNYYRTKPEQQPFVTYLLDEIADRYDLSERDTLVADQWAKNLFEQHYSSLPPIEDVERMYSCPQVGESLAE